jgi:gluconate 5-dehydrogenase
VRLFDLTGRLALVTGSSRGMGLAIARGPAEAAAAIVRNRRDAAALAAAQAGLATVGNTVHAVPFDVTDPPQRASAARGASGFSQ